jgi:rod shape-determining protein MreD
MSGPRLLLLTLLALAVEILASLWPSTGRLLDPLLVVAILAALGGRTGLALAAGLLTGFVEDFWSTHWIGENAFTHATVAYLVALSALRVDLGEPLPAGTVLVLGSLFEWGLHVALTALFGQPQGRLPDPWVWLVAAVLNAVLGLLLYRLLRRRTSR